MLKSIRENRLTLPEPEAVRAALTAAGRFLLALALSWALSRAVLVRLSPMAGLAPFAMALFAAGLSAGQSAAGLLAGCLLGAVNGPVERFNLALPIGCAAILAGSLAWSLLAPGLHRLRAALRRSPDIQARSPNPSVAAAALSGLGVLLPGLFYAGGEIWPSALSLAAALAALASAPFLRAALGVRPDSRFLLAEERAGLCLLICAIPAGLCALPPLALLFAMTAACLAASAGALLGLGGGVAMLLITGDARFAALLGACGGAAQLCRRLPRPLRAGGVACAALAGALLLGLPPDQTAALCAAPPLAALVPVKVRARVLRWAERPGDACDPDRLAAILRGQTSRRLQSMGAAFRDLAEGYLTPAALPDEQALMTRLRACLCDGCPGYGDCWNGGDNRAPRLLCDLAALAVEWSDTDMSLPLFGEGVPHDIARRCRRSRQLADRVGEALEDFARRRRAELKRGGENRLISAQFLQAAQLIEALAREQARPIRLRDRQAKRAAAVLERGGVCLSDALLLSGPRTELILTLREGLWNDALAARAAGLLSHAFGRVYAPESAAAGRTMRFLRLPRLQARVGAASVPREAGSPSGDSCVTARLDDGRLLALICDGMGSGEAAARESGAAARLLERFLAAGSGVPLAMETVNALMLGSAPEDMFSTVDLMLLDLSTGMADFLKLAACPALIAREGEVRRVEGGRLPLGILEKVEPAATQAQLLPGDTVLLASDGVMDAADPDALQSLLLTPQEDMNALSESVLALAREGAGSHPDDMTAICVRIALRDGTEA